MSNPCSSVVPPDTPLEVLADVLKKAEALITGNDEVKILLKKAIQIASGLDEYLEKTTTQPSPALQELWTRTRSERWHENYEKGITLFDLPVTCITGHVEGQVLRFFARMAKAQRVLEIGMFTGYGALSLAEGLPLDGTVVACEIEPYLEKFARLSFDKSPHGKKIKVEVGGAQETINQLANERQQYDLIFIDADKTGYLEYYKTIIDRKLLAPGGTLVVDNVLFKGQVYGSEEDMNENGKALKEFNQFVASDPRTEQVLLPVRDGMLLIQHADSAEEVEKVETKDDVYSGLNGKSVMQRLRLDGKTALVTGAGQGIGRAFAHALGEAGAQVAVVDIDTLRADRVRRELISKGIKAISIQADITNKEDVDRMVDQVISEWGALHIACNNAGVNLNSASKDTTLEEWDRTMNVNLRGVFLCCQAEGRAMMKQGYGKIINTASMSSLIVPHPQKQLSYNTSKAGVVKLTQTLGTEWIDRGVRVNAISPGIVDTPLIHNEALKPLSELWLKDIPAGRFAEVTDLQGAIVFLASEASDYMTGHNLAIEGGQSLW
ncbi:uncharacterized protein LOC136030892 isoform X2 [Artemia franciscana]|uniref:D-arabinitol 2-dehydrogenase [ribulose-forming] n=1 Tax=Artemia franciscana TaxID=6661 RepID=A0AA88H6Z4_ARTSF|nr:hypothetical protein QYM36_016924 [Artemia franciscana]